MVPYMSFLLQPSTDILKAFTSSTSNNIALWSSVIQTYTRVLNLDDGGTYFLFRFCFMSYIEKIKSNQHFGVMTNCDKYQLS